MCCPRNYGGHVRPSNNKCNRPNRRLAINQNGKRQVVVVGRKRDGQSLTTVAPTEAKGREIISATIHHMSTVYADEASHWDDLHAKSDTRRINHSVSNSNGYACTNQAESFFSRLLRMEIGTHHHIAGPYLAAYAAEASFREDNRRVDIGGLAAMVGGSAMESPVSRQ